MALTRKPPNECPMENECASVKAESFRHKAWHLDKTVSVGHIFTTISAMALFIGWAVILDRRITTLEIHDMQNTKDHREENGDLKERLNELKSELKEQRKMLERLLVQGKK